MLRVASHGSSEHALVAHITILHILFMTHLSFHGVFIFHGKFTFFQGVRRIHIALPHEQKEKDGAKMSTSYSSISPSPIPSSIHRRICNPRTVHIHLAFANQTLHLSRFFSSSSSIFSKHHLLQSSLFFAIAAS